MSILPVLAGLGALTLMGNPPKRKRRRQNPDDLDVSFDVANRMWKDGRISDTEMRSFAHRWVKGKASHRLHNGRIEALHTPRYGDEYWLAMSGSWNTRSNPRKAPAKSSRLKPVAVRLAHGPNPDIGSRGGYWSGEPSGPRSQMVAVASLKDAQQKCLSYIYKHGLGAGNWYGGEIFGTTGEQIANVAYNGTVLPGKMSDWKPSTRPLKV